MEVIDDKKKAYKDQILDISNSSNIKFNNQQIQLQGIESVIIKYIILLIKI